MPTLPQAEIDLFPLLRPHLVVVLDDDLPTLEALRRALRREPYEVMTAHNPLDALSWVESTEVSLLITDQRMPLMEGTQVLAEVRRRSPHTTGVILTGYPETLRMEPGLSRWVRSVIVKPWDDLRLRATLRRFLRERPFYRREKEEDSDGFGPDLGGEA